MKVIVGLGNPGEKYLKTRHNVGFMVVDRLRIDAYPEHAFNFDSKFKVDVARTQEVYLIKPQTFMNDSGEAVSLFVNYYKVPTEELYVIHDDLDISLGEYKIHFAVGPKLHYGISSIEERLGTKDFWRVRVGVDNRKVDNYVPGEEYVLQPFLEDEKEILNGVITRILQELQEK